MRFGKLVLLFFLLMPVACATTGHKNNHITLLSSDFDFISDIYKDAGKQREVSSWLVLPDEARFKPPYPAVVFLHSSWGLSDQEWHYSQLFADMGIASLVIDSFRSRGVRRTSSDQSLVSSASMLADAFAGLDYLSDDARFLPSKIAIMGFSKGAIVAFYSSLVDIQKNMESNGNQFAGHLAFYPWCGLYLKDMQTSGVPIAIHGGSKDVVTPLDQCAELVDQQLIDGDKSHIQVVRYEGARHAFDHPVLQRIPFAVPLSVQIPGDCRFVEETDGQFTEASTGQTVNGENISHVLAECSRNAGVAGRNRDAAKLANENAKMFMRDVLLN